MKQLSKIQLFSIIAGILVVAIAVFSIFASTQNRDSKTKLNIVTTLFPYYDLLRQITPEEVNISLIGEGIVDPHSFDPSPSDLVTISQADVIVMNGVVDEYIQDIIESENISSNKVFEAIQFIGDTDIISHTKEEHSKEEHAEDEHGEEKHGHDEKKSDTEHTHEEEKHIDEAHSDEEKNSSATLNEEEHNHSHDHDHGGIDPHIWMSPRLMSTVKTELITYLEKQQIPLVQEQRNTDTFKELTERYNATLTSCRLSKGIVTHAAFDYLVRDYNLELYALSDITGEANTTQSAFVDAIDIINDNGITYILADSNSNNAIVESIQSDVDVQTLSLNSMEVVDNYKDESYVSIMNNNLTALQTAFQCQ